MEYQATEKYVRVATRKVRLMADAIRALGPVDALARLKLERKSASDPLSRAIASALANAAQKKADTQSLRFKTIEVMGGPAMKRFRAVSRGQAHSYKKRMTHIRIIITDEPEGKK